MDGNTVTKQDVLLHECIWGYEFGTKQSCVELNDGTYSLTFHKLVCIETKRLAWLDNDSRFALWWSLSDPPFSYRLVDYQQTWCFNPTEMFWVKVSDIKY